MGPRVQRRGELGTAEGDRREGGGAGEAGRAGGDTGLRDSPFKVSCSAVAPVRAPMLLPSVLAENGREQTGLFPGSFSEPVFPPSPRVSPEGSSLGLISSVSNPLPLDGDIQFCLSVPSAGYVCPVYAPGPSETDALGPSLAQKSLVTKSQPTLPGHSPTSPESLTVMA